MNLTIIEAINSVPPKYWVEHIEIAHFPHLHRSDIGYQSNCATGRMEGLGVLHGQNGKRLGQYR